MTTPASPIDRVGIPDLAECPYKGLQAYTENDGAYFFGRDADSDLIIANLLASRLTVLYGPSGVGKSSLLQAGVVRALRRLPDGAFTFLAVGHAIVVYFASWRQEPLNALGEALRDAVPPSLRAGVDLPSGPLSLELVQAITGMFDADVYLLLDQFEEQALYLSDPTMDQFAAELGRIVVAPSLRAGVLIGVREDALAKLDRLEAHVPNLFGNNLRLDHLHEAAAREAIEQPLIRHNEAAPPDERVTVEPGLVDELLQQLRTGHVSVADAGQGGAGDGSATIETPFLQLVMTRLWSEERSRDSFVLRQSTLHELGGAELIVRTHLDTVMNALTDEQRDTAAKVFRHLVTPSGMKIAHTAQDLADYAGSLDAADLTAVLEDLASGRERILRPVEPPVDRPGVPRYEIFHDVLAPAVLDWRRRYVTEQERAASQRHLVAQQHAAEQEHRETRRRLRRFRLISAGLALLLVATAALGVYIFRLRDQAEARVSLGEFQQRLDSDPAAALHAALQAHQMDPGPSTTGAVRAAYDADLERFKVTADPGYVAGSSFAPDARSFVTAGADGVLRQFEVSTGRLLREFPSTSRNALTGASFSSDGAMVAVTSQKPDVNVYDVGTGRDLLTVTGYEGFIWTEWGTLDGQPILVTGGPGKPAQTWRPSTSTQLATYGAAESTSFSGGLSRDASHLVIVDGTTATVWDTRSGKELAKSASLGAEASTAKFVGTSSDQVAVWVRESDEYWVPAFWKWATSATPEKKEGQDREPSGITVSADGKYAAMVTDKSAVVYDTDTGDRDTLLPDQPDLLTALAFSPDDEWLMSGGTGGRVGIWRRGAYSRVPVVALNGHLGEIADVHFAPEDPEVVLTSGYDGTARLWQLPSRTVVTQEKTWIQQADLSPDGSSILTVRDVGTVTVSDVGTGEEKAVWYMSGFGATVYQHARWLPDGRHAVISSSWEAEPMVWDTQSDLEPRAFEANDQWTSGLTVNATGDQVAMGDDSNRVVVWDVATGKISARLTGGSADFRMLAVAFVPRSTLVAGASTDGTVRVWDLGKPGEGPRVFSKVGSPPLTAVAVSVDGRWLASAGVDRQLRIYPLVGEGVPRTILGPASKMNDVSFSHDSSMVAVAADDGAVHVWDWRSGDALAVLHRHGDAVKSVEFMPGDDQLVTASDDGTAAVFDCTTCGDIDSILDQARARDDARSKGVASSFG